MKLIEQSHEVLFFTPDADALIETAGRTCYKSHSRTTPTSSSTFIRALMKSGHHSVLEHGVATVKFITNRGVTHELVRHRLASYSQESTRYVKYDGDMEFIMPVWWDDHTACIEFATACKMTERSYQDLLLMGWKPEQAREVLPNALKTEIVMTANFREWMHVFKLRCSKAAHPQIRDLMLCCLGDFSTRSEVFQIVKETI